jgi:hypothetical protein
MEEKKLVRANKVTVKLGEDGRYVADFYRTHKKISTITDAETAWEKPADSTKTGERESFRGYVIKNADIFGIEWKPDNLQDEANRRSPKYENDGQLSADVLTMITPDVQEMVNKCKYGITLKSVDVDEIVPMQKTSKGTLLSGLGIVDGKYEKSGNWAWANIKTIAIITYKEEEVYYNMGVELVSGQLKKPKLTITAFTEDIKNEIINAGLATAEELDPPKEASKPEVKEEPKLKVEEIVAEDVKPSVTNEYIADDMSIDEDPQPEVVDTKIENKSGRQRKVLGKKN